MAAVPSFMLKRLYVSGSLKNIEGGFEFSMRNNIAPGTFTGLLRVEVDGEAIDLDKVMVGRKEPNLKATDISHQKPLAFSVTDTFVVRILERTLGPGEHKIVLTVNTREVGRLSIPITDTLP